MSTAANKGERKRTRARSTEPSHPLLRAERQIDRINLDGYIDLPAEVRAQILQDYRDRKRGHFAQDLCDYLCGIVATEAEVRAEVQTSEARAAVRKGRATAHRQAAHSLSWALATPPPVSTPVL